MSTRAPSRRTLAAAHAPIATIMTRDVVCVERDLSVEEVTRLFLDRGLHGAPVVDEAGALCGFVATADLLRARDDRGDTGELEQPRVRARGGVSYPLGEGFHLQEIARATVGELMTPVAITLPPSAPIGMAAAMMAIEGVHRMPVVSAGGRVVGILSALDLLRWVAEQDGYRPRTGAPPEDRPRPPAVEARP
jgi:CBS domain-containing protein